MRDCIANYQWPVRQLELDVATIADLRCLEVVAHFQPELFKKRPSAFDE